MRFNRLDLNLLVALDHLMTLRSISRTAEKMHLSQPAMSNALARLREYFGDPLLVQVGRQTELTPKAKAMQFAVRDILVRIEATVASEAVFDPAVSDREFRILLSDFSMIVLMPTVLALARDQAPGIRFRLQPQLTTPSQAIERGEADLLIVPHQLLSPRNPWELLCQEELVCIAWKDGPYGREPLTQEMYVKARHIRMTPPNAPYFPDEEMLERADVRREIDVQCYSFASMPFLICGTDRLATMQRSLAERLRSETDIVIHPNPIGLPPLRQTLQWHVHRDADPGIRWLNSLLHQAVDHLGMDKGDPSAPA